METISKENQVDESSIIGDDSYVPPRIEVIEVFVEKGFADSTTDLDPDTW